MKETKYKAEDIKVLKGLEAVRKRPAMYIGSHRSRRASTTWFTRSSTTPSTRPWPASARTSRSSSTSTIRSRSSTTAAASRSRSTRRRSKSAAEVVMTMLHAGGKFDDKSYKVSGGLHGVGVSVVNALSKRLDLEVKRDGGIFVQSYERGIPLAKLKQVGKTKKTGTKITFWPDDEIFPRRPSTTSTILTQRMRELTFLNKGIRITITDERIGQSRTTSSTRAASSSSSSTSTRTRTSSTPGRSCSSARRTTSASSWPSSTTPATTTTSSPSSTTSTPTRAAPT